MDLYSFYTGKCFEAFKFLGAHFDNDGVTFCTYAPRAYRVSLIGEFSDWNEIPMKPKYDSNFYFVTVPDAKEGQMYKFRIYHCNGFTDHCDPYGYGAQLRPDTASIIRNIDKYKFNDAQWMEKRTSMKDKPLNIYEAHLGSWKTNKNNENGWYNYAQLSDMLPGYLTENGYNAIEIMPLCEYPSDESWGYQETGYFAPTARYGSATELMELIDKFHQSGIAVILDFVPVHFALDNYAIANYDGTQLYEYPSGDVGFSEWGSCNFIHSKGEVRSFLQSSANYWLEKYHFDGLRMDAISRMIYWCGEPSRGVNSCAVDFLKEMNAGLKSRHKGIILAAEDSTDFPKVTASVEDGGLGFDYKWDMGWMNDTLSYFQSPQHERIEKYHKLTFSMMYYYNEHYILPLSHDENVHGKATVMQKMCGDYENKFPQARAFYMYMYVHPGKKLNFMGSEFGQLREWSEKQEQDWAVHKYPLHDSFHEYIKALNRIYMDYPSLSSGDYAPDCFRWVDCHQEQRLIYAIERSCIGQSTVALFNFSDTLQRRYIFRLKPYIQLKLLISSDWECFSGKSKKKDELFTADKNGNLSVDIPPFSGLLFLCIEENCPKKEILVETDNV